MTTQHQDEYMWNELNEQQWRVFLGTEALEIGYGGISQVAKLSDAELSALNLVRDAFQGE